MLQHMNNALYFMLQELPAVMLCKEEDFALNEEELKKVAELVAEGKRLAEEVRSSKKV